MEIKGCPFCGGEAIAENLAMGGGFLTPDDPDCWACGCRKCDVGFYADTEDEAIAAWNNRAGWVGVEDGLPEDDPAIHKYRDGIMEMCSVLVCRIYAGSDTSFVEIANRLNIPKTGHEWHDKYATDGWEWSRRSESTVTHWMPLPPEK